MKFYILFGILLLTSMTTATALTWDGTTNEGCVNFEPLGSCPETAFPLRPAVTYTNTVRNAQVSNVNTTFFDYNETVYPFTNISYMINNNSCNTPFSSDGNGCFKIEIVTQEGKSVLTYPVRAVVTIEFNNGTAGSNYSITTNNGITVKTEGYKITGNQLNVIKNYSNGTTSADVKINWTITIKGKTLFYQGISDKPKVYAINQGSLWTDETGQQDLDIFHTANFSVKDSSLMEFIIINRTNFFNNNIVWDKSDHSAFINVAKTNSLSDKVQGSEMFLYYNLTNRSMNIFNTTSFVIVSGNVNDLYVYEKNVKTTAYDSIKNKWFFENWYSANCQSGCAMNITKRYNNYGFDITNAVYLSHYIATPIPSMDNYTNGWTRATAQSFNSNITALGGIWGAYNSFQDIYTTSPLFNSTTYYGRAVNATNLSMIMKYGNNGSIVNGWPTSYVSKWNRRYDILQWVWSNMTIDWGNKVMFLSTDAANIFQLNYVDMDFNESQRGISRLAVDIIKPMYDYIRTQGYWTTTEDYPRFIFCGIIDNSNGNNENSNEYNHGFMPDYELTQLTNKCTIRQGYTWLFMKYWNMSSTYDYGTLPYDEYYYDRFIIKSIAQKQQLSMNDHDKVYNAIPDNLTILNYYAMRYISNLQYATEITNVSYYNDSGAYLSSSQAVRARYSFFAPYIYEEYSNGLRLYINLNSTNWWNVSVNGATRNLPPNGLYAYTTDGTFEMFFNDNNQSTWVRTPTYIYLYPKNDATITFTVPSNYYLVYKFYGDDSTNGRLLIQNLSTPISSYTTKDVVILYPYARGGDVPNYAFFDSVSFWSQGMVVFFICVVCWGIVLLFRKS